MSLLVPILSINLQPAKPPITKAIPIPKNKQVSLRAAAAPELLMNSTRITFGQKIVSMPLNQLSTNWETS